MGTVEGDTLQMIVAQSRVALEKEKANCLYVLISLHQRLSLERAAEADVMGAGQGCAKTLTGAPDWLRWCLHGAPLTMEGSCPIAA